MKKILTSIYLVCISVGLFANQPTKIQAVLNWQDSPIVHSDEAGNYEIRVWRFEGAQYDDATPELPYFFRSFPVDGPVALTATLTNAQWEAFDPGTLQNEDRISESVDIATHVTQARNEYRGKVRFIPIRRNGSSYERLISFTLTINSSAAPPVASIRGGDPTLTSALADGTIYKMGIATTGMYKLTYDYLVNTAGVDLAGVDPRNIQLLGNGGGALPELVSDFRYDDLQENPILIEGEADGSFDPGDYILFYAQGPSLWSYDENADFFEYQRNTYDDRNYYFLKIGNQTGLRITTQSSTNGNTTSTSFDDHQVVDDDLYNLLNEAELAQGSGQQWVGDYYKNQRSFTYDNFSFPNLISGEEARLRVRFAARADGFTYFTAAVGGSNFQSDNFDPINLGNPNAAYALFRELNATFSPTNSSLPVTIEYPALAGVINEGWLDYIQLNVRRELRMSGDQMGFRDAQTLGLGSANFQLQNANGITVWDVTDPIAPKRQAGTANGGNFSFGVSTEVLREFIAFNPTASLFQPTSVTPLANQNLHGITETDMVIIYHPDIYDEAKRLADHRTANRGLGIQLIPIQLIYNEFSSGRRDAVAIRDFAKMIHDRTPNFQYMLLFGDGSYDHRNIDGQGHNLVITYQTRSSNHPIFSYPSDDFFGLLSEGEGNIATNDDLDISIGRLPVRNLEEARIVVDKIINYDSNPATLGDWRSRVMYIGDDEDNGVHTRDADNIADDVSEKYPWLNTEKVYIDAFNQISTPGGKAAPGATEAMNNNIFRGVLTVTYLGHGGAKGWAQEQILKIPDITSWTNFDKLPVFVTATCSFAGYDDPSFTTAGEQILLNRRGGGIALFTTVRAVYASTNELLTRAVCDTMFAEVNGHGQAIGDILRLAKNEAGGGANSRRFTLLGDPSMLLAIPRKNVVTTSINGVPVGSGTPDTLRALQKVTIAGEIRDNNGALLSDYNGTLFPSVFDKEVEYTTLGQDGTPLRNFVLQNNALFKGRASVTNGQFEFTFVVPKDINFDFGNGKISYYGENGSQEDAGGAFEDIIIGGTDPNALADDEGPQVDVYMNSIDFVFGGMTSPDPTLLVVLEDDLGINVVGNSIGHDLTGVLDENTQNTILLNSFYEAALDDYTRGEVRYPLSSIAEGRHSIRVKAWDVANNSAEGYTEFVVAGDGKVALDHVLNYPNPFINSTCFQFEHNMENQELEVLVSIYTVSGRLVKTIEERIIPLGSRLSLGDCIQWDGKDDFGDPLARGVYLYKVRVRAITGGLQEISGESDFEKLVILR
jgi:hypothetical protein